MKNQALTVLHAVLAWLSRPGPQLNRGLMLFLLFLAAVLPLPGFVVVILVVLAVVTGAALVANAVTTYQNRRNQTPAPPTKR